jgi:ribosomal-protein-alanine N-acetyltransferase
MIFFKDYIIDKIAIEDARGIHRLIIANKERFKRFLPVTLEQNSKIRHSRKFVREKVRQYDLQEELLFTIKFKKNKEIIGFVYIKDIDWIKKKCEFAYCIDINFEGMEIISQSIGLLSQYAFNELGLITLQIIVHQSNKASVKVAQKCGYLWKDTLLNEHTPLDEAPLDMELYELNK